MINTKCGFFVSCLEFALINSLYSEIILKPKQVICLEKIFCKFGCACCFTNWIWKIIDFLSPSHSVVRKEEWCEVSFHENIIDSYCCVAFTCANS